LVVQQLFLALGGGQFVTLFKIVDERREASDKHIFGKDCSENGRASSCVVAICTTVGAESALQKGIGRSRVRIRRLNDHRGMRSMFDFKKTQENMSGD
jgi:hypothetical protein